MVISKRYTELKIKLNNKNSDSIYNLLYFHNINNLLEENTCLKSYLPEDKTKKFLQIKKALISKSLVNSNDVSIKPFLNKDWTFEWKKTIRPVFIKDKIIIYPSWLKKDIKKFEDRVLINIDPKMSFGTGHNATTQLVLELMCRYITSGDKKLLDFGSGTGVLAVAGIKLGMNKAVEIDIDEDSVRDSKEYLEKNSVSDKIKIYNKNISEIKENNFDVICANIIRTVIEENIVVIYKKLSPGGKLFLSGILKEEENSIRRCLKKNSFHIFDIIYKAEWIGIYARSI